MPYFKIFIIIFYLNLSFISFVFSSENYSKSLNSNEEQIFKASLSSGDKKKWARSLKGIEKINNPVARKILIWRWLIAHDGIATQKELENFFYLIKNGQK